MVSPTCLESWGMAGKLCSTGTVPQVLPYGLSDMAALELFEFLPWQLKALKGSIRANNCKVFYDTALDYVNCSISEGSLKPAWVQVVFKGDVP